MLATLYLYPFILAAAIVYACRVVLSKSFCEKVTKRSWVYRNGYEQLAERLTLTCALLAVPLLSIALVALSLHLVSNPPLH